MNSFVIIYWAFNSFLFDYIKFLNQTFKQRPRRACNDTAGATQHHINLFVVHVFCGRQNDEEENLLEHLILLGFLFRALEVDEVVVGRCETAANVVLGRLVEFCFDRVHRFRAFGVEWLVLVGEILLKAFDFLRLRLLLQSSVSHHRPKIRLEDVIVRANDLGQVHRFGGEDCEAVVEFYLLAWCLKLWDQILFDQSFADKLLLQEVNSASVVRCRSKLRNGRVDCSFALRVDFLSITVDLIRFVEQIFAQHVVEEARLVVAFARNPRGHQNQPDCKKSK